MCLVKCLFKVGMQKNGISLVLQNLHINVTINGSWWLSGDPTSKHGNVILGQNDGQPLPQLPGEENVLDTHLSLITLDN